MFKKLVFTLLILCWQPNLLSVKFHEFYGKFVTNEKVAAVRGLRAFLRGLIAKNRDELVLDININQDTGSIETLEDLPTCVAEVLYIASLLGELVICDLPTDELFNRIEPKRFPFGDINPARLEFDAACASIIDDEEHGGELDGQCEPDAPKRPGRKGKNRRVPSIDPSGSWSQGLSPEDDGPLTASFRQDTRPRSGGLSPFVR